MTSSSLPVELAHEPGGPGGLTGILARYRFYVAALTIFIASRLTVAAGSIFGYLLAPAPGEGHWFVGDDRWYYRLARWDTGWYHEIVAGGYRYTVQPGVGTNAPFFPLYPLLSRWLHLATGVDDWAAMIVVANAAALAAVVLFAHFARNEIGEQKALLSVACFSFFPTSFFFSAGYAEPLCLAFVLLSFILLARRWRVGAAIAAGLASASRITGIVMLPVIVWELVRDRTQTWPGKLGLIAICGVLSVSGVLGFMAHHWIVFGDPWIVAAAHEPYHGGRPLSQRFIEALTFQGLGHADWLRGWVFIPFLLLSAWSFKLLRSNVALYGLGTLLLPYVTLGLTPSMTRFVIMCFPAFMVMGIFCHGRPLLAMCLIGVFGAGLLALSALFSEWYWIG